MADVTKPYTFTNQTTADANQVNQDFDTLYTAVNGGLDNNNIKSGSLSTAIATEGVTQSQTKGVPYAIDLYGGPFLFSGFTVTKDGTTLTQVNVTAGVALTKQVDGNLRRITTSATNFRVATNSATYYLDLNPDGSWWWANSGHSTQSNYINVATVTSDASGNVSTVTQNTASYQISLLSGATGGSNFLRTDSGAPNPQTVANPVTFDGQLKVVASANQSATETILTSSPDGSLIALIPSAAQSAYNTLVQAGDQVLVWNSKGASTNASWLTIVPWFGSSAGIRLGSDGSVSTKNGQLGSASGTWSVGSVNVPVGTVINVAAVPSGAKNFIIELHFTGTPATGYPASVIGSTNASGSGWYSTVASSGASTGGISSTTIVGSTGYLYDGSYRAMGYFQINGGYLQFVVISSSGISGYGYNNVWWGVS